MTKVNILKKRDIKTLAASIAKDWARTIGLAAMLHQRPSNDAEQEMATYLESILLGVYEAGKINANHD